MEELLRPELLKVFKPAFLGRLIVVPYLPLSDEILLGVVRLQLSRLEQRVRDTHGAALVIAEGVEEYVAFNARNVDIGARAVEQTIARQILPELSRLFLNALAAGKPLRQVELDLGPEGLRLRTEVPLDDPAALIAVQPTVSQA